MKSEELAKLINKAKKFGTDFNGTLDSGLFDIPQNAIVITGESEEGGDYVRQFCSENHIPESNIHYYDGEDTSNKAVAEFKAKMIEELEVDCFFENNPNEVYWIKKFNPTANVHYINSKSYVIFSYDLLGLGYALRLKEEGNNVVIALMEPEDAGFDIKSESDKEFDKRRRTVGDGLVTKYPAKMVFKYLKGLKDKEDYFIDFDFNYGSNYAEELEKMGFKGLFPRETGRELEKDREKGQNLVKDHYKLLNLPEEKTFKKVQDAIEFINEQENIYVIKANNPDINCFVPASDSTEIDEYREEVTNYLEEQKSGLESDGFMLQKKIEDCVEATPEACYIDGKPVYFVCCIENKFKSDGELGEQTGCGQDLNFVLDPKSKLVEIGDKDYFPIAKKEKLNNFVDAGILFERETGVAYFTEFCFDTKTEALTRDGWKNYADLRIGQEVLSINPNNQVIEWRPITKVFVLKHNGKMVSIKGKGKHSALDALVTPDHKFWMINESLKKNKIRRFKASSLPKSSSWQILRTGIWEGNNIPQITLPSIRVNVPKRTVKKGAFIKGGDYGVVSQKVKEFFRHELSAITFNTESLAGLLGLWIAEGSFGGLYKDEPRSMFIAQSPDNPKRVEIEKIFDGLPSEVKLIKRGKGYEVNCRRLVKYLWDELGLGGTHCDDKFIPSVFKELSVPYLKAFLNGYLLGDGSYHRNQWIGFTTSKRLADDLQEVIHKVGWSCTVTEYKRKGTEMEINGKKYLRNHNIYTVSIRTKRVNYSIQSSGSNVMYEDYCGIVWDVSVEGNESLFVRRNGRAFFSSNCHSRKGYNAFYGELAMCPSVSQYFEALQANTSPFNSIGAKRFAASIRIFNTGKDDNRYTLADLQIMVKGENVWLVDAKMKEDTLVTAGFVYDTAVITGAGDTPEEAIKNCQDHLKEIKMKEEVHRIDIDTNEDYGLLARYYYLENNNLL
jgi:hypothetical protein